jgi:DNA-binding response OmpR family regulator
MIKILVAEDNKDLNMIMVKRLEASGFAVDSVDTGYALLGHLKASDGPDAIILDLMLPGRSGIELLDTIIDKWEKTKVFIFSAYSQYGERHMMKNYSIAGYFCKSDGLDKLIDAVKDEFPPIDEEGR